MTTTIIGGRGRPGGHRRSGSRRSAPSSSRAGMTHFDKGKLRERMARLIGGVARDQGRRADRDRAARAPAPRRGRGAGDARGPHRGHPPGRRRRADPRAGGDRRRRARARRGDRRRDRAPRARGAAAPDRRATPASSPPSSSTACAGCRRARASTRRTGVYCDLFEAGRDRPDDGHPRGARARRVDREDRAHRGVHRLGPRRR